VIAFPGIQSRPFLRAAPLLLPAMGQNTDAFRRFANSRRGINLPPRRSEFRAEQRNGPLSLDNHEAALKLPSLEAFDIPKRPGVIRFRSVLGEPGMVSLGDVARL